MLECRKVAVTGSLSCGKSTVCRYLKELGADCLDADVIVHQLLLPQSPIGEKVRELLGDDCVIDEQFDRKTMANKVFNNPTLLSSLEKIVHPAVKREIEAHFQKCQINGKKLFVAEVPLLFEAGWNEDFDHVITVYADPKICLDHFLKQDQDRTKEEFEKRMARQLDPEEKRRRADFVLINENHPHSLREKVNQLFPKLIQ